MTARLLSSAFTSAPLLLSLGHFGLGRKHGCGPSGGWRSLADGCGLYALDNRVCHFVGDTTQTTACQLT